MSLTSPSLNSWEIEGFLLQNLKAQRATTWLPKVSQLHFPKTILGISSCRSQQTPVLNLGSTLPEQLNSGRASLSLFPFFLPFLVAIFSSISHVHCPMIDASPVTAGPALERGWCQSVWRSSPHPRSVPCAPLRARWSSTIQVPRPNFTPYAPTPSLGPPLILAAIFCYPASRVVSTQLGGCYYS